MLANRFNSLMNIVRPKKLISEQSAHWIIECYKWALNHFDQDEFKHRTCLIQPTNQFFSGNVSSVHQKAENIFQHSLHYAGLTHWPFQLVSPSNLRASVFIDVEPIDITRNSAKTLEKPEAVSDVIQISYDPQQTLKPEDLASNYAHLFAQYLVLHAKKLPPGGEEYIREATEVLAVFMGFGVLLANSAYTFRGGCGSCYNPAANRAASLSENEVIFALALFCHLKGIVPADAHKYLKRHLKSSYSSAVRQVREMNLDLQSIKDEQITGCNV